MPREGPVRLGIAGLGRAGYGMHVPEVRPLPDKFRIVAGCDQIEKRGRDLQAEFGAKPYTDYQDLISDPGVELVVIATRSDTHCKLTVDALEAGKDVLVEKPMAVDLDEAETMIEAARRTGRRLLVRHNRRLDPDFVHVREVIDSGVLGEVFYVRLCRHNFNRRTDWQTLKAFSGGQLHNWGPHLIDHALQLMGGLPVQLFCDVRIVAAAGDAEDHVKIVMKNAAGLVVDVEISGGIALGEPPYRVMGTLGTLVSDGEESRLKYLKPDSLTAVSPDQGTPEPTPEFGNPEELPWVEETRPSAPAQPPPSFYEMVYRCLRLGEPFHVTLEEAKGVMAVIDQVMKQAEF